MKNSITIKVFLILFTSILTVMLLIGVAIKVALPDYYKDKMVREIASYESAFETALASKDQNKVNEIIAEIKNELNGNILIQDSQGEILFSDRGQGHGRNQYKIKVPEDAEEEFGFLYLNPNEVEFYVYGMYVESVWIIYQAPMESIKKITNIVSDFYLVIVWISLGLSVVLSFVVSRLITKPIIHLNNLTQEMKALKMEPLDEIVRQDEIGLLTNSVIILYKELVGNIEKLEKALVREKSLDKLRKQFVYRVSHELQTPFAVIQGYSEALRDGMYENEAEMKEYLKIVYEESENMSNLIKDILDLSKLESGVFEISKEVFELNNWLENIANKFSKIVDKKGLIIKIENDCFDEQLLGDSFRLEQAIKNLLINAIEHSDAEVILTCKKVEDKLAIRVYNSGEAIQPDDLNQVFESFYKKKGKKTGVGLGLSIVKSIIELHAGNYSVKNINNGVMFTITVPFS